MKRSDAVNSIKELIEINLDNLKVVSDASLIASLILYSLEKKGMLPPCRADFGGHGNLSEDNSCKDYVESCDFTWEAEDETK